MQSCCRAVVSNLLKVKITFSSKGQPKIYYAPLLPAQQVSLLGGVVREGVGQGSVRPQVGWAGGGGSELRRLVQARGGGGGLLLQNAPQRRPTGIGGGRENDLGGA